MVGWILRKFMCCSNRSCKRKSWSWTAVSCPSLRAILPGSWVGPSIRINFMVFCGLKHIQPNWAGCHLPFFSRFPRKISRFPENYCVGVFLNIWKSISMKKSPDMSHVTEPWRHGARQWGTSRLPSSGPSLSTWFGGPFEWRALGNKKNMCFLLENLVKFGKFQQNLENMVQKNMGCSNLNDLVKKICGCWVINGVFSQRFWAACWTTGF